MQWEKADLEEKDSYVANARGEHKPNPAQSVEMIRWPTV